jgi:hypothetical protein
MCENKAKSPKLDEDPKGQASMSVAAERILTARTERPMR